MIALSRKSPNRGSSMSSAVAPARSPKISISTIIVPAVYWLIAANEAIEP
jgi:hypothetical protein